MRVLLASLWQSWLRVCIGREGKEVPRLHCDTVYYSSHTLYALQWLPDQFFVVVYLPPLCGCHCSSWRMAVYAERDEGYPHAKHSTWYVPSLSLSLSHTHIVALLCLSPLMCNGSPSLEIGWNRDCNTNPPYHPVTSYAL